MKFIAMDMWACGTFFGSDSMSSKKIGYKIEQRFLRKKLIHIVFIIYSDFILDNSINIEIFYGF